MPPCTIIVNTQFIHEYFQNHKLEHDENQDNGVPHTSGKHVIMQELLMLLNCGVGEDS